MIVNTATATVDILRYESSTFILYTELSSSFFQSLWVNP